MQLLDISHDTNNIYRLKENEKRVFFLFNRSGTITFELHGKGAQAHVFAFFTGEDNTNQSLTLIQKHTAPNTSSAALVKSVLNGQAAFHYAGKVRIEKKAQKSVASQESRSLLLSKEASAHTKPALEILADDVQCHHAATVSPLNESMLFYAKSRGLSEAEATKLLVQGFFGEALEKMQALGIKRELIPQVN